MAKSRIQNGNKGKSYTFIFTFPELPAGHAQQSVSASGSSFSVAMSRAAKDVMKREHVKGRRIKHGRISFSFNEPLPDDE